MTSPVPEVVAPDEVEIDINIHRYDNDGIFDDNNPPGFVQDSDDDDVPLSPPTCVAKGEGKDDIPTSTSRLSERMFALNIRNLLFAIFLFLFLVHSKTALPASKPSSPLLIHNELALTDKGQSGHMPLAKEVTENLASKLPLLDKTSPHVLFGVDSDQVKLTKFYCSSSVSIV